MVKEAPVSAHKSLWKELLDIEDDPPELKRKPVKFLNRYRMLAAPQLKNEGSGLLLQVENVASKQKLESEVDFAHDGEIDTTAWQMAASTPATVEGVPQRDKIYITEEGGISVITIPQPFLATTIKLAREGIAEKCHKGIKDDLIAPYFDVIANGLVSEAINPELERYLQ